MSAALGDDASKGKVLMTIADPAGEQALDLTSSSQHLQRRLTERQISMIALGSAIGVGLFLGSSVTINLAGPAVILNYILGAILALIVAYAVAEMAVVSEEGQKLWVLKAGAPGGPEHYVLGRLSVLPEVYKKYSSDMMDPMNPFDAAQPL